MACGVFFARRWGSLGSIVQGQGTPTSTASSARPVKTGSAEHGCSVWKLTFRAAMNAAVPTSVSSPDVRFRTGVLTANHKLDWFGTARGRVGFIPTDRVLLCATGGLAYGQLSATAPLIPLSWGSTRAGWTFGAGAEVALDHNWSFKVEYLYMDLGNIGGALATATTVTNALNKPSTGLNTVTTTTTAAFKTRFTDNLVRVGVNYRFGGPVVAKY
jgi:opacity protein-like surface antigen